MNMIFKSISIICVICLNIMTAQAATGQMTTTAKELLYSALNGDGRSRGLLDDAMSRQIREKFYLQPDAIVEGVVDTVKVLSQECSRLKLTLNVPDLRLSQYMGGPEEMFSMWYELNLCKDGMIPGDEAMRGTDDELLKHNPADNVQKTIKRYYRD